MNVAVAWDNLTTLCWWCGQEIYPLDNCREVAPVWNGVDWSRRPQLVHARCEKPYWHFRDNI